MLSHLRRHLSDVCLCIAFWASVCRGAAFDPAIVSFDILHGSAQSSPCCVSTAPRTFDCFVRGPTSNVLHFVKNKGGRYVQNLGGIIKGDIECLSTDMGIVLLAVAPNNTLIWSRASSGNWTEWMSVGQSLQEVPSCIVRGQCMNCMGRGTKGEAITISFVNGQWEEWNTLEGILASPPGCTVDADDFASCFSVDGVNTPQVIIITEKGEERRQLNDFSESKGRPSAFTQSDGKAASVFLDFHQNLILVNEFGGGKLPPGEFKSPAECLTWSTEQDVCFAVGQDAHLYRLGDGVWVNSWFAFGFVGTPSCATTDEGEITCCTRGISNNLLEVVYRYTKPGLTAISKT